MLLAAALALSLTAAPPKPFTAGPSVEGVSEYALPNGLKVLLIPDPSKPTVLVNLVVRVGSRNENYGEKGMAHLFEHMLFKKTKKFASVKEELTKLGGMANGTTWYDRTNYFEAFPYSDEKFKTAIELEAQRLRSAIISREQLSTEMTVVRNEFEAGENNPGAVLSQRVYSAAYQWHNYGNDTIGARSDIENVPNEKLLAFYDTYYQPDNATLVVAGHFDEAKAFKYIADTFGKLPKPKRAGPPPTYTVEPIHDGENAVTVRRVGGTPVLMAGYHMSATSDPDAPVIDVLQSVLGDSPSGRLYKALVETKKAANVSCSTMPPSLEAGFFTCDATLNAGDSSAAAREAMLSVLEGVGKKPVTKDEVERARAHVMKSYELLLNDSQRLGRELTEFIAAGDWRLVFLMRDRTEAVTADDVNRVAQKYLKQSNRTFGEYVPTEKPDRSDVPALVDVAAVLKDYKGREALAEGEAFEASPRNIDARTTRSTLSGGARVALLPKKTRGETVRALLVFRYGDEKSLMNTGASSDLLAGLLMRGTKTKSRQQVKDALDALKAQVSFSATPQAVTARIEVRKPQLKATLDLVAELLKSPALDAKEFEELKRETLSGLDGQKDDPQAVGFTGITRELSPFQANKGHPLYVETIPESIANVKATTLDQVKAFYGKFYGAQAADLAVVGDFDAKDVQAQLEAQYGSWKAKESYTRIPTPYVELPLKNETVETPDKQMAFFAAGQVLPLKDADPEYPALLIADFMLGGGFLNGRVPQRLREKEGLSYGVGTFIRVGTHDNFSALMGYAIYAPQNMSKVESGFFEEVAKAVSGGFTADELKLARESLLRRREQGRSDDMSLCNQLVGQLDMGRTAAFDQEIEDRLRALSIADVNATLKKYVDPKKFEVIKVGDFKQVAAPK